MGLQQDKLKMLRDNVRKLTEDFGAGDDPGLVLQRQIAQDLRNKVVSP
jgi:hypothetical protein